MVTRNNSSAQSSRKMRSWEQCIQAMFRLTLLCCGFLVVFFSSGCPEDPCLDWMDAGANCLLSCPTGQQLCNNTCVNPENNPSHCGSCGNACKQGYFCDKGECKIKCPNDFVDCGGECVDLQNNKTHCGLCNAPCQEGQVCQKGACTLNCPEGFNLCSGRCVDLSSDRSHCGLCGKKCATGQTCEKSSCKAICSPPFLVCDKLCRDVRVDNNHCGSCGNPCPKGQICTAGTCEIACSTGFTRCDDKCVDTNNDKLHCGLCKKACKGDEICSQGNCVVECPTGLTLCDGACVNLQQSPKHCGSCNSACTDGKLCSEGACSLFCGGSTSQCGSICVDKDRDAKHCGACNSECLNGERCLNGSCEVACPNGYDICTGNCSNIDSDRFNCGKCGTVCKDNETCINKKCEPCEGCPMWLKSIQGALFEVGRGIAFDNLNNVYTVGTFQTSAQMELRFLRSKGIEDIFVAKQDKGGNFLWARSAGGNGFNSGYDVAVSATSTIYLTGSFQGQATFGTLTLTSKGNSDIFVAAINKDGKWLWATSTGGSGEDTGRAIAVDGNDNVYIAGSFQNSLVVGTITFSSQGRKDVFLGKLDKNGGWKWGKSIGGTLDDEAFDLVLDSNKNIYIAGAYSKSMALGSTTLNSAGGQDAFFARMDTSQDWTWAVSMGGRLNDVGRGIAVSGNGEMYITGDYRDKATLNGVSLQASGDSDVFVSRLDAQGVTTWVRSFGGGRTDSVNSIALDSQNNVYLLGTFAGRALFDLSNLLANGGLSDVDVFAAKLDDKGAVRSASRFGSRNLDSGQSLAIDGNDRVLILGVLGDVTSFGKLIYPHLGGNDTFVAKYNILPCADGQKLCNGSCIDISEDPNNCGDCGKTCKSSEICAAGNCQICQQCPRWVRRAGGSSAEEVWSSVVDSAGNVYLVGQFEGTASFGTLALASRGDTDVFVAKISPDGSWIWVRQVGGLFKDVARDITIDANDNLHVAGFFGGTVSFGSTTLQAVGGVDVFVASLSTNGTWGWASQAGGLSTDNATAVASDGQGGAYVAGSFTRSAAFGSTTLTSSGLSDIFVAHVDNTGSWTWSKRAGGQVADLAWGVAANAQGQVFVSGYFGDQAAFGTQRLTSAGSADLFVASLDKTGAWKWIQRAGSSDFDEARGLLAGANGDVYVTGYFQTDKAAFGSFTLSSFGDADLFIAHLDNKGEWDWVNSGGSTGFDAGSRLARSAGGDFYVIGEFRGNGRFDGIPLLSSGSSDMSLLQFNVAGRFIRAVQSGGGSVEQGRGLAVDAQNNLFLSGLFFSAPASFGLYRRSTAGSSDIFITRFSNLPCDTSLFKVCGNRCVDPKSDPAHCGSCNNACSSSSRCVSAQCKP